MQIHWITKSILLAIFVVSINTSVFSQCGLWTLGSAKTIDKDALKVGAFTPMRYGITNTFEVQSHLWVMYPLPNISVKKQWHELESGWLFGSIHSFYYPTPAYRLYSRYSLVPLQPIKRAPHLFQFRNEIRFSKILKKKTYCEAANYLLTLRAGNIHVFGFRDTTIQTLDYPLLYRSTAVSDQRDLFYVGADLEAWANPYVNYAVDLDFYLLSNPLTNWFLESKVLLYGKTKPNQTLHAGFKMVLGNYPTGVEFDVMPVVEYIYHIRLKKSKEMEKGLTPEILTWGKKKKKKSKKGTDKDEE